MKIVVTLCTRRRPRMLRDCLESLLRQRVPAGVSLSAVVVENNETEECRAIVEELAGRPAAPDFAYAHEPRIGIPIARNRTLDLALEHDPDWIVFLDDDEVADPDWIACFARAATTLDADVLHGPVEWIDQGARASRVVLDIQAMRDMRRRPTGTTLKTAATNNTMMRARLVRADGLGLRFSEALRFTGGSDTEFFSRAVERGAVIRWVDDAVVRESVPAERFTLRWQLQRERRVAANNMALYVRENGLLAALARKGPKCLGRLSRACVELPVGVVLYSIHPRSGARVLAKALRKLGWVTGSVGAFVGVRPQPYLTVEGH